jgi:hypothetical protein
MGDNGGSPEASEGAIREAERRRISRELHASTSQLLVALQLQLGELRRSDVPTAGSLLDEMAQVIRDIHNSIGQISSRQSDEKGTDCGKAIVAKMFYSLGTLNRSA